MDVTHVYILVLIVYLIQDAYLVWMELEEVKLLHAHVRTFIMMMVK